MTTLKNKVEQIKYNIIPQSFEINFYLNDLTKSKTIELKENINVTSNYFCGVKNCKLINLENDDYWCNLSYYVIDRLHYDNFTNIKQSFNNLSKELEKIFKKADPKALAACGESYSKIVKQINNNQSLFEDYVDEIIKLHSSLQTKYSFFNFNKDFNTNILKIKKKFNQFTFLRLSLLKSFKNIPSQLNQILSMDNNIKIVHYSEQNKKYSKLLFPPNYTKIIVNESGGNKYSQDRQGTIFFSYNELENLSFPIATDLIYDPVCNNNIIHIIDCKNKYLSEDFEDIEHINYYPVAVSNINRFKINVSDEIINFIQQTKKKIKIVLHFKLKNG